MNKRNLLIFIVFAVILISSIFFTYKRMYVDHNYDTYYSETEELSE